MEIQRRTIRRSKHSSRPRERSVAAWSPLFLCRFVIVGLLIYSPWIQGSANWREQIWLTLGTIVALLLLMVDVVDRWLRKAPLETLRIPWASLSLFLVACYAWVQTVPVFSIDATSSLSPNSVQIQRWFLGYPNPRVASALGTEDREMVPPSRDSIAAEKKLAISIEPLHTRAAIPGLVMVSVMIWVGSVCFFSERWLLTLMIVMTLLGVLVGLAGMIDILAWNRSAIQIVPGGSTFGVYVSRNCGGDFS